MKKCIFLVTIALVLACFNTFADEVYPFSTASQQVLFDKMTKEYRCLTCQNQNLAESSAPVAMTIKDEIYTMVINGQTQDQIDETLYERYGDYLFYEPPVNGKTALLWFLPFCLLVIVMAIFLKNMRVMKSS